MHVCFTSDNAPQKRCDQLWCSSKPGGVMFPPELIELTIRLYSSELANASEELGKDGNSQLRFRNDGNYLMKRVSRNWSRPTKDFTVR